MLGLWAFTNLELAYALLRVEERLRTYATASLINVGLTIGASLALVVGLGEGARGLLLGNYGATHGGAARPVVDHARLACSRATRGVEPTGVLLRFGLPTVPAEASVYALSIIDRYYIFHHRSAGAGRPVLDRGQAGRRGRVHRARLPVRLAAAGLFGPR